MSVSLKDWLSNGWLVEHQTTPEEITDLFGVAQRDIADARIAQLSPDWRLNIAYNAALQLAIAALAAEGFRPSRDSHHYRAIQSLAYTIHADQKFIWRFEQFRKKRNIGEYERAGGISDTEAAEMCDIATELYEHIKSWIKSEHPELI
jgi:hypothetical protein